MIWRRIGELLVGDFDAALVDFFLGQVWIADKDTKSIGQPVAMFEAVKALIHW